MAILKCKMCGGDLNVTADEKIVECEFCGTTQTIPDGNDEKKANLFNRANRLRMDNEFDKAAGVYESIVSEYPEESEGYWGLVLCAFGIEYVDDAKTGKKIPTCHRTLTSSVMDDDNFAQACENADVVARGFYREEAKAIDRLQQQIIAVVENEEPYDVFICYKETDDITKSRTEDSLIAQDIYTELIKEGYKVFFSRVTLRDKAGTEYEPYIYAALKSAKIMLAIGTKFDYYDAVWVKNEWGRFIAMMADDNSKHLIPCYKNLDAYDIPKEFKNLQALDMGEVTFFKNLTDNVERFIPKQEAEQIKVVETVSESNNATVDSLLKRAFIFLEDGDWDKADEYAEKVLDIDPECSDAYLIKLLIEYKINNVEAMGKINVIERDLENAKEITILSVPNKVKVLTILCKEGLSLTEARTFVDNLPQEISNKNGIAQNLLENEVEIFVAGEKKGPKINDILEIDKNLNYVKMLKYKSSFLTEKAVEYIQQAVCRECERIYQKAIKEMQGCRSVSAYSELIKIFNSILSYKDCEQLSRKCSENINGIIENNKKKYKLYFKKSKLLFESSGNDIIALKKDGTVVSSNSSRFNVEGWKNIISIAVSDDNVIGLKSDGTVIATSDYGSHADLSKWKDIVDISAGFSHVIALKSDGTVIAASWTDKDACKVNDWTDIIKIKATSFGTVGLKSDGTVLLAGNFYDCSLSDLEDVVDYSCESNRVPSKEMVLMRDGTVKSLHEEYSREMSDWRNIISISAGYEHTVGLKSDGTVVATEMENDADNGRCNVDSWQDIVAIDTGDFSTIGLKADGRLVCAEENELNLDNFTDIAMPVSGETAGEIFKKRLEEINCAEEEKKWGFYSANKKKFIKNMQSCISASVYHTVALKTDGTAVAVGDNDDGQCNVSDWKDIVSVSAGISHSVGLKLDGRVVAAGDNTFKQCDVSEWNDIISISARGYYTVGVKSDGTVMLASDDVEAIRSVSCWEDIVAASVGMYHIVGLKANGTVVTVGDNDDGQCNVSDWKDIVAISAGDYHTAGLKVDGSVVIAGDIGTSFENTSDWQDIVAISAGNCITVGLKADSSVMAVGKDTDVKNSIRTWSDVVAISIHDHAIGIKKDGSVIAVGENDYDCCDVSVGADISLPINAESIEELKSEKEKQIRIAYERYQEEQRLEEEKKRQEEERLKKIEEQKLRYRNAGLCQYCGGGFKGLITKTCTNCGQKKDY